MEARQQIYLDACLSGDTDTIVYMIKTEDLNFRNNKFLMECLEFACRGNHIDVCKIIISHRNTFNNFSYDELYDIVFDTCRIGNLDIYRFYLSLTQYYFPKTICFREACKSGNIMLVKHIFDNNKDLLGGVYPEQGDFLCYACRSGNIEIVNFIITHGCCNWNWNWNWGLNGACGSKNDNVEIFNLMIKKGATSFKSCFQEACLAGNLKIIKLLVKLLVKRGDHKFINWNQGMNWACSGGHLDVVNYMISKGATGWNNGMCEACGGGHLDIVKLMISKGAYSWDNGLYYAGRRGCVHIEIVKFMLLQGATNFSKCLECACFCGDIELVRTAIEKGATNWNQGLEIACRKGHTELVKLMLEHGATNLSSGMFYNITKNTNIYMLLIKKGVDDLNYLQDSRNFRLSYMYSKFVENETNCINFLPEYPPCVLFVGARLSFSLDCCAKKLPVELFKVLAQYI